MSLILDTMNTALVSILAFRALQAKVVKVAQDAMEFLVSVMHVRQGLVSQQIEIAQNVKKDGSARAINLAFNVHQRLLDQDEKSALHAWQQQEPALNVRLHTLSSMVHASWHWQKRQMIQQQSLLLWWHLWLELLFSS